MIHGVLNVYKEKGFTSHDVVAKLRGITKQKKIGHTGTLDPDAEGVLPVCFGKATKLCDMLTDKDKVYETVLLLGKATDTQDITGTVLEEKDTTNLTEQEVLDCIQVYIGEYQQIPPMYSALKVNGKKLVDLAREGKVVERKSRTVWIYDITILEMDLPRVRMSVHCSKGTYIRTLCHDIGEKLGVGGCMESLLRTKVERFTMDNSLKLADVENQFRNGLMDDIVVPIDQMFSQYAAMKLKPESVFYACNGNPLKQADFQNVHEWDVVEKLRVYDDKEQFIGIYEYQPETKVIRLVKMFYSANE